LERALKAAGGNVAPGSRLGNYKDFKEGRRKIEVKKKLSKAERRKYAIALLPFNIAAPGSPAAEDRYRATITQYSDTGRKALTTLSEAKLGYAAIDNSNNTGSNFFPALLKLFVPTNAETPEITNPTSGVTGQRYSRIAGASYSVPFGRGGVAVADGEEKRRLALAVEAKTGNGSTIKATGVSYEPEYFGNTQADVTGLPGV
jgi:hypothetical protein